MLADEFTECWPHAAPVTDALVAGKTSSSVSSFPTGCELCLVRGGGSKLQLPGSSDASALRGWATLAGTDNEDTDRDQVAAWRTIPKGHARVLADEHPGVPDTDGRPRPLAGGHPTQGRRNRGLRSRPVRPVRGDQPGLDATVTPLAAYREALQADPWEKPCRNRPFRAETPQTSRQNANQHNPKA